jgi:hypothetical protein
MPLKRLSFTAPPPKVALLPDALFFTRAVAVSPTATSAEVATQVELALEAMAPFPVAQMYHGYHWRPGFQHALVFAAYRKRFTTEQTDAWGDAEVVLPTFASLLNAKVERATTLVLTTADGITAVHWDDPADAPTAVIARAFSAEATESERATMRDDILRTMGGTRSAVEINETPAVDTDGASGIDLLFRSGKTTSGFTREELDALDVRDKADLAARRRARLRDLTLWRIFVGCAAAMVFAALLEAAMIGASFWQETRQAVIDQRAPVVAEIEKANDLATRIEELSTKRLLPLEMIELLRAKKPDSVVFTRITTTGVYSLEITAQTNASDDMIAYRSALLEQKELLSEVTVNSTGSRDGVTSYRVNVTFAPAAVKPEVQS